MSEAGKRAVREGPPTRAARRGTGRVSTSRSSPTTPRRSRSVSSTTRAKRSSSGSSFPSTRTKPCTATSPTSCPARTTAIACTVRTRRRRDIASTRTSCCSIPMRERTPASCDGISRVRLPVRVERRPHLRRARQCAVRAEVRGRGSELRLEGRAGAQGDRARSREREHQPRSTNRGR